MMIANQEITSEILFPEPLLLEESLFLTPTGAEGPRTLSVYARWSGFELSRVPDRQDHTIAPCSPNEDAEFAQFTGRFVQLVADTTSAADALNSQSRNSKAAGIAYGLAFNHHQSKTSWCLSQGNPNIPRFRAAEAELGRAGQRALDVMFANLSGYFFRIGPALDAVAAECRYIDGGSVSAQGIAFALQQLQKTEEQFEFGLGDARIQNTIRDINAKYQSANAELARALTQLFANASARMDRAEAHVSAAVGAIGLMNQSGYDGQIQFDAGATELRNYDVQAKELARFILFDDGSGRLPQLRVRAQNLATRLKTLVDGIPTFEALPTSSSYEKYGSEKQQYGKPEILAAVESICADSLASKHKVSVGAMCYEHGGTMQFTDGTGEHKEHKRGLDADLDLTDAGDVGAPGYKRDLWIAFLTLCAGYKSTVKVLFSDQEAVDAANKALGTAKVKFAGGHTKHCHLSLD